MKGRWPFTAEKVATRIALIAPHVVRRRVPLEQFRLFPLSEALVDAPICNDPTGWEEISHESYWGHADLNFVMKSGFTVPEGWRTDRLALHLPLGALGDIFNHPEALVHIDRQPIGSADRYHHTIPLDAGLADGRRHVISLHGWTGLAGWPPDPTSRAKLYMGTPCLVERDPGLQAFHDRARAVLDTASMLEDDPETQAALLEALDAAFKELDTRDPIGPDIYDSVPAAMDALTQGVARAGSPLDVTVHAIGHAHMDIAYLWPISQIRLKNARTYSNVLRLMEEEPDYVFSHSQPALYEMTEQDYPALFEQIKTRVAQGRWEVLGGMWVEPDLNIPCGESLVRQITLGRGYFRDRFGDVETPALWLPDTFGFPGQIPQLMKLAGLPWFVTNKLNWNQCNKVPWSSHTWEGIDGSRVLAHVLTTPRDVQYLPFPTNYKSDLSAAEVLGTWTNSSSKEHVRDLPICFGYGDGGGGPTEDLLAKAKAYAAMPGMPRLKMGTVQTALSKIADVADQLPVWRGEHYMEGHRGVFTSQGWIKRANRKAEWALHEAEALCAMAGLSPDLTDAWKLLCLNQFHDIITGTSVRSVFEDARRDFDRLGRMIEHVTALAGSRLAPSTPSVANTAPISMPRLALLEAGAVGGQPVEGGTLVLFDPMPAYSIVPVHAARQPENPVTAKLSGEIAILENAYLRVEIAPNAQLLSVFDKRAQREVLKDGETGNQLQVFEDRPICWDAWDIDPFFEDRQDTLDAAGEIEMVETGPLRAAICVRRAWQSSTITQTIRLAAHSARIDFETDIDWHETHTLLKAAFPTTITTPVARFDVQWGRVERATKRDTPFDAARFEVPAQKWAQLSEADYAVALLNDCKYGYDVREDTLRITLIKCATSPDPTADQGAHHFTYAFLPIPGADPSVLDREAYDLNAPLRSLPTGKSELATVPFVQSSADNIIIETVKPAEDGAGVILRLFEAHGRAAQTRLSFEQPLVKANLATLEEQEISPITVTPEGLELELRAFEILTVRVQFAPTRHA